MHSNFTVFQAASAKAVLLLAFLGFSVSNLWAGNTIALKEILDANGRIANWQARCGAVDFSGFFPVIDDCEGLILLPAPPPVPGWNALGSGLNNDVSAIAISGNDVYVGGSFTDAGGNTGADYIARWDGSAWHALGSGVNTWVYGIAISGTNVYVTGGFINAGGNASADGIARWDGSAWHALGNNQVLGPCGSIVISGDDVYASGYFDVPGGIPGTDWIARWDGSAWHALGNGVNGSVYDMASSGSDVYMVGGFFNAGGNASADGIARWDGSAWHALGIAVNTGVGGVQDGVGTIAVSGSDVYVGGSFIDLAGNSAADGIARWDGSAWHALGSGLNLGNYSVGVIAISGSDVYVGGTFFDAGNIDGANRIARWDGSAWHALGNGVNISVNDIAISGSDVYVGGQFSNAGGIDGADRIARWEALPSAATEIRQAGIRIFPNPTTGEIRLDNVQADHVDVYDATGSLVLQVLQPGTAFHLTGLTAGLYHLKIGADGQMFSARVVKE